MEPKLCLCNKKTNKKNFRHVTTILQAKKSGDRQVGLGYTCIPDRICFITRYSTKLIKLFPQCADILQEVEPVRACSCCIDGVTLKEWHLRKLCTLAATRNFIVSDFNIKTWKCARGKGFENLLRSPYI